MIWLMVLLAIGRAIAARKMPPMRLPPPWATLAFPSESLGGRWPKPRCGVGEDGDDLRQDNEGRGSSEGNDF